MNGKKIMIPEYEFIECKECSSKTGSPVLCNSCLHNRSVIANLGAELKKLQDLFTLRERLKDNQFIVKAFNSVDVDLYKILDEKINDRMKYNYAKFFQERKQ